MSKKHFKLPVKVSTLAFIALSIGAIFFVIKGNGGFEPRLIWHVGDQPVEFQEVDIRNKAPGSTSQTICYFTELPYPEKKVIRTQQEYESYLAEAETQGYKAFSQNRDNDKFGAYARYGSVNTFQKYQDYCKDQYRFPEFDFSKYTLLGQFTPSGGCSVDFDKTVTRNDTSKKLNYTIDVKPSGGCEMAISSSNWILVPSIPNDYLVDFAVLK